MQTYGDICLLKKKHKLNNNFKHYTLLIFERNENS